MMSKAEHEDPSTGRISPIFGGHFGARDPASPIAPLDEARVEVLLKCIDASHLTATGVLQAFVQALHQATWGNPDVFPLLALSLKRWKEFDDARARATLAFLWDSFDGEISESPGAHKALKLLCNSSAFRLSPSILHAIFDDPSLDFYAFIEWHGPLLDYRVADDGEQL